MRPARRPRASTRTSVAPRIARAASTGGRSSTARSIALDVAGLQPGRDQEPEDGEERRDERVAEQHGRVRTVERGPEVAQERQLLRVGRDAAEGEERVEDDQDGPEDERGLHEAEDAADQLIEEARLRKQRLGLVQALGDERERDGRGQEHGPEPDHQAVLLGELGPVLPEVRTEGLRDVRGEEEREQDRGDPDQASDRALGEPEHEERHEVQEDEQVDRADPAEEIPEIHRRSFWSRCPGRPRSRARLAAALRVPQGDGWVVGRIREVRGGPEWSGQVRRRASRSPASPAVTWATTVSTSA